MQTVHFAKWMRLSFDVYPVWLEEKPKKEKTKNNSSHLWGPIPNQSKPARLQTSPPLAGCPARSLLRLLGQGLKGVTQPVPLSCASKNRNSKMACPFWKWKGPEPAVCPSCLILSHTQIAVDGRNGNHGGQRRIFSKLTFGESIIYHSRGSVSELVVRIQKKGEKKKQTNLSKSQGGIRT